MELLASGFNAWGQLDFATPNLQIHTETHDFLEFKSVLRGNAINQVQAFLSYTTLTCNGKKHIAGQCPKLDRALLEQHPEACPTVAQASNGSTAIINQSGVVTQSKCLRDVLSDGKSQGPSITDLPSCAQLVAYDTGFAALTTAGDVYTWGDERYGACLGREVSDESPADRPGLVTALQDLPTGPISKIAGGGYMLAALTTGNDLYLWGGHPGRATVPADVSDEPAPVVIEEQDIADVAVGEAHLVVLTTEGRVYVIGHNGNGQLGLPIESTNSWRQVETNLDQGKRAVGVAAGPRNSFIIIDEG